MYMKSSPPHGITSASCPQLILSLSSVEEATDRDDLDHTHCNHDCTNDQGPRQYTEVVTFSCVLVARLSSLEEGLLQYHLTEVSAY